MKRIFNDEYHAGITAAVEITAPDPYPADETTVTLRLTVDVATALGEFIRSGGVWKAGLELNSILHNLRPALLIVGITV